MNREELLKIVDQYIVKEIEDMVMRDTLKDFVSGTIKSNFEDLSDNEIFEEIENSDHSFLLLRNISVSSATHRPQDLIPRFLETLRAHDTEWYCAHITRMFPMPPAYAVENDHHPWWQGDQCGSFLMDELWTRMELLAPEGFYFGSHPGDGSDFGFWEVEDEDASSVS